MAHGPEFTIITTPEPTLGGITARRPAARVATHTASSDTTPEPEIVTMPPPFLHLRIERPLAFLDLESTGIDPAHDRVVEIALLKVAPDARALTFARRIHPARPIPPQATALHGISDDDVAERPHFKAIAPRLARLLDGCDLAGF